VAVCSSRASASSRVRALTCCCRSARVELACRVAVRALSRLGFVVLLRCVFAGLRVVVRRRLTEPSHGPTTIHYHIVRAVVHHSTIRCRLAAMGHSLPYFGCQGSLRFVSGSTQSGQSAVILWTDEKYHSLRG
jgi:hypothetical protein